MKDEKELYSKEEILKVLEILGKNNEEKVDNKLRQGEEDFNELIQRGSSVVVSEEKRDRRFQVVFGKTFFNDLKDYSIYRGCKSINQCIIEICRSVMYNDKDFVNNILKG